MPCRRYRQVGTAGFRPIGEVALGCQGIAKTGGGDDAGNHGGQVLSPGLGGGFGIDRAGHCNLPADTRAAEMLVEAPKVSIDVLIRIDYYLGRVVPAITVKPPLQTRYCQLSQPETNYTCGYAYPAGGIRKSFPSW